MPARKNWIELLTIKSKEDKATNLTVNNIELIKCKNLNGKTRCDFVCYCGEKGNKSMICVIQTGLFCKTCINKKSINKMKKTNLERYGEENPSQLYLPSRKNWIELLTIKSKQDKATNLTVNNTELIKCKNLKRTKKCDFICNCGEKGNRTLELILKIGLFCKKCTEIKKINKRKETCLEKYGVENTMKCKKIKDKIKATNLKKYGVENPFHSQEVKDKVKATNLKKYGVENPFQSQIIKDKIKATNLEKYGVEHAIQSLEIKEKSKYTCFKNFGVEYPMKSEKVKDKLKKNNLEKYGVEFVSQIEEAKYKSRATCLKKYGVEYSLQSKIVRDKGKATNFKKYGVEHNMQCKSLFDKNQKAQYRMKSFIFKTGEIIECQGYEPQTLKYLEQNNNYTYEDYNNWNDIEFWYNTKNRKKHRYYPDIPFLKQNKIIEVKSDYTFYANFYINLLKAQCVFEKGYDFEFWIYDNKKKLSIIDSKFMSNKFIVNSELLDYFKYSKV